MSIETTMKRWLLAVPFIVAVAWGVSGWWKPLAAPRAADRAEVAQVAGSAREAATPPSVDVLRVSATEVTAPSSQAVAASREVEPARVDEPREAAVDVSRSRATSVATILAERAADALHLSDQPKQAAALADWAERRFAAYLAQAELSRQDEKRARDLASAFNVQADRDRAELLAWFGVEKARALFERLPSHRVNPTTGRPERVDFDGVALIDFDDESPDDESGE